MLKDSIAILAATTPPPPDPIPASLKNKNANIGAANARIYELETELGVKKSPPTFNFQLAARRVAHLENLLSQMNAARPAIKPSAAVAPVAASPVPPVATAKIPADDGILQATRAEFLKMDFSTRRQFAQDGGHLKKSDFEKLTLAARSQFCVAGGKILDDMPANRRSRCTAAASFTSHEN
jgi:hypothetical protein